MTVCSQLDTGVSATYHCPKDERPAFHLGKDRDKTARMRTWFYVQVAHPPNELRKYTRIAIFLQVSTGAY